MVSCLQAELELGRPLTQDEVKKLYINTVAEAKALGRPLKSSTAMIAICLLSSWLGVFIVALIASWFKG